MNFYRYMLCPNICISIFLYIQQVLTSVNMEDKLCQKCQTGPSCSQLQKRQREVYLKTTAATWFNKICKNHQLTPKHIKIEVNGKNKQSCNTKNLAVKYGLNQELELLYKKKKTLSEKFYRTHLECGKRWNTCIQTSVESKLPSILQVKQTFKVLVIVHLLFSCIAKLATKIKIQMFGHHM